jgi:hypothetical protein
MPGGKMAIPLQGLIKYAADIMYENKKKQCA